jgi:phosphoribosylformylglycinamidine synthase
MSFKNEDDIIILLGQNKDEIGGSLFLSIIHGLEAGRPPELDLELEKLVQGTALKLIKKGLVTAAHDCSEGGLAVALAECCVAGGIGAEILLTDSIKTSSLLYGETQSRIIITTPKDKVDIVLNLLSETKVPYKVLGDVGGNELNITGSGWKIRLEVTTMEEKYRGAIKCIMNS